MLGADVTEKIDIPFLKNTWYVAGWASEFDPSAPRGLTVAGEPVVFYRTRTQRLVALADRCAHRWAPLSLGRVEGDDLRCMYHGVKFSPAGQCVEVPGQDRIAKSLCVRSYPVVERHRLVWIWMGEAARADPNLIADLSLLDQPGRRLKCGSLDYKAHYSLVSDNLLDLSHFGFLHQNTLGRTLEASPDRLTAQILGGGEAKPIESGVRVIGWLSAQTVFLPKVVRDGDLWSRVDFLIPGIYFSHGQVYPHGTAEQCNGHPPGVESIPLCDSFSIQAVTPMTDRTTRYSYSIGSRVSDMENEEADEIWAVVVKAFAEDLEMIQAQQRTIDTHPGERMGGIAADRGLTLFRQKMRKMIADETPSDL